ncbi:formate dehydrogenase accessory sulfurtransferase FdhD [Thermogemmatispora onikobensis]|uniref:formate dehydrogenase accessory sulfurtransferase FdhD n=1 Tax=Thermogemmatispora onikobensis TaxID=732234 RepID=UPI000A680611|nr:formate dehydrogenase accessory sulfurtransferase FdhD [Thermogemmatispora onikobensis]
MTATQFWRSIVDPLRVMSARVLHWEGEDAQSRDEALAVEEPLEVRLNQRSLAIIMRTPGHDRELALGFLLNEGLIRSGQEVLRVEEALDADGLPLPNVIEVTLRTSEAQEEQADGGAVCQATFERHFAVSSSCGLCGKNSIADLLSSLAPLEPDTLRLRAETLYALPERLRVAQAVFSHTGGLHAAALFSLQGELLLLREDVGRHNAVDKLVGWGLLQGNFPYREHILMVSGRTSFEIIQKALSARIPCVAAISAPSSLAVELAEQAGITLVGFLRGRSMNVYTHPERLLAAG